MARNYKKTVRRNKTKSKRRQTGGKKKNQNPNKRKRTIRQRKWSTRNHLKNQQGGWGEDIEERIVLQN